MGTIADRLRQKRLQHQQEQSTVQQQPTDTPEASHSLTPRPSDRGPQPIMVTREQIEGASLQIRTVKFFSVILESSPLASSDGIVAALIKRLQPRLIKMLGEASEDDLRKMYQAWIVGLTQVYNPNAVAAHIDLTQRHLWTDEVQATVEQSQLPRSPDEMSDDELLALADAEVAPFVGTVNGIQTDHGVGPGAALDPEVKPARFTAGVAETEGLKPPSDIVETPHNDEPMIGIEVDGEVVMVTQSYYEQLKREAAATQIQS